MSSTAVVVTNCTQRKRGQCGADLAILPDYHDVQALAVAWQRLVARAAPTALAQHLYQGRSIADAAAAAANLRSPWFVVSAGLGLVRADKPVPTYECTVAAGSELSVRLKTAGATTADWWNAITVAQPRPLSRLVARSETLLALPSGYLRMVHDDLALVPLAKAGQLRIFTSTAGARFVPEHLARCVMPYDDRLEAIRDYAGTQSDFAQRALRHFVEALHATSLPLETARAAVSAALADRSRRARVIGTRMSDGEIQRVLKAQWARHAGSSTRLLRYLRDEARISCEQKRFSRLWQALAAELRE